jgi:hypothetical protein
LESHEEIKASTDLEFFEGRKNLCKKLCRRILRNKARNHRIFRKNKVSRGVSSNQTRNTFLLGSLGVWVVRESVRKALEKPIMKFSSKEELLSSSKKIGKIKYGFELEKYFFQKQILDYVSTQKRLNNFF